MTIGLLTSVLNLQCSLHRYKKRKIQRRRTIKQVVNRNEQFEKIAKLREEYSKSENPILSVYNGTQKVDHKIRKRR